MGDTKEVIALNHLKSKPTCVFTLLSVFDGRISQKWNHTHSTRHVIIFLSQACSNIIVTFLRLNTQINNHTTRDKISYPYLSHAVLVTIFLILNPFERQKRIHKGALFINTIPHEKNMFVTLLNMCKNMDVKSNWTHFCFHLLCSLTRSASCSSYKTLYAVN
jgi:hypothetical protein